MSGDRNGESHSWESIGYVKIDGGIVLVQSASGDMRQIGNNGEVFFGDIVIAQGVSGFIVFFEGNPSIYLNIVFVNYVVALSMFELVS